MIGRLVRRLRVALALRRDVLARLERLEFALYLLECCNRDIDTTLRLHEERLDRTGDAAGLNAADLLGVLRSAAAEQAAAAVLERIDATARLYLSDKRRPQ